MKRTICWMLVVGWFASSIGCCCWVPAGGRRGSNGGYGRHGGGAERGGGGLERK